jgi:serine/threonine-protein kinase
MTSDTSDPFVKGQRIDRYEIREHVGQGGMGAVYRAVDTKLGRTVALKTVVAHRRGDRLTDEIRERFMREALAASRVDHRNVVQVLDFGFADDGTPYMVMEFLRGQSLSERLKRSTEPMTIDSVADIMLSVCAALRACHHVDIIHRDLKPANIFLCDTDTGWEIKVLDFGISKAPATDELTQDGQIIGTPQYLSPEQVEGAVGPESDQYALGVLLYVCLTRRLPYSGHQGARLLRAISEGTFDPPRALRPDLPEELEAIVLRAMHLSPGRRFESIHALGQRLWAFASPHGQAQWKTFYFHTPASSQLVKPTTVSDDAELRAIPRPRPTPTQVSPAAAAPPTPVVPLPSNAAPAGPRVDSTASFAALSAVARAEAASRQPTVGPAAFAVTKTSLASSVSEASPSHSDIAGESALSDAGDGAETMRHGRPRWRAAVAVAAVACAGIFAIQRASHSGRPAAVAAAPSSVPARPAAPPAPQTAGAAAEAKAPAAPAGPTPEPQPSLPPAPPAEPPRRKHATHRHRVPKLDQHGIGIPAE